MAIDKSKENTRITDLLAMTTANVRRKIAIGLENPQIFSQFMETESIDWNYAVPAQLLSEDDVKWIKEHVNEENTDEQTEP